MLSDVFYFIIYPILLLFSLYLGESYARRFQQRTEQWKVLGIENGVVGFYALLVSFSLAQAASHHLERGGYIHDTGDKMALMIRKSQLYDPELRQQLKPYFAGMLDIQLGKLLTTREAVAATIDKIEVLDNELDKFLVPYAATSPERKCEVAELILLIEQTEDAYYRLIYSYHERTPRLILLVLMLFSLLICFLMGFIGRMNQNKTHITSVIFIIISFLILNIIHDLDTPAQGFIRPNFEDIQDVKDWFYLYHYKN